MTTPYDVCVIGGGPAGAIFALRLAQLGRKVALVERALFPRNHVGSSLSAGVLDLLDVVGLRHSVVGSDFFSSGGASVSWAGELSRRSSSIGHRVQRGHFDAFLLNAAKSAGVAIYHPDVIVSSSFNEPTWCLALRSGGMLNSRYLADAAGRSGCSALRSRTKKIPLGVPTFAMYAYWHDAKLGDGESFIEAGSNHWYWGAPLPDGTFLASIFIDRAFARESPRYCALISESTLLGSRLSESRCRMVGGVRICDATPYLECEPVSESSIRLGDAVLSLDPISSQGVQVAISTALRAASVAHTILGRPENAELAMAFYRSRVTELAGHHRTLTITSYRRHSEAGGGSPFWQQRSHGAISASFEFPSSKFLSRPLDKFRISRDVSFAKVGVIHGDYVVEVDGLELGGRNYAYFDGSPIASLFYVLDGAVLAGSDLVAFWSRALPPQTALHLFHWSCREGLIVAVG